MRIHTNSMTLNNFYDALNLAKQEGRIARDVTFDPIAPYNSRSHQAAFEVQLGATECSLKGMNYTNQYGKPQKTRRTRNAGYSERGYRYSATWHEWGWFINEIFKMDPSARIDRAYKSRYDFDQQTRYQFTDDASKRVPEPPLDPVVFYTGDNYVVPRGDIDHATRINREV